MKKIMVLLLLVTIIIYACTKESLRTQSTKSLQQNNTTLAGNKYLVTVSFKTKLQEASTLWLYKDKGSFMVTLDGAFGGTISNVKNHPSNISLIKNKGTCVVQLIAANKGNIEIAETGHVGAFGGQVFVTFDTANVKTKTPLFTINCDGNPYNDGGATGPGAPVNLQFLDNGQKQVYTVDPFTITVDPQ